jgi:hypothetical protein
MRTLMLALAVIAPISASACPLVNGKFTKSIGDNSRITIGLYSKMEGGQYLYNFDVDNQGPYFVADGVEKRIEHDGSAGYITASCSGNTVSLSGREDGNPIQFKATYTLINENTLRSESNDDPEMNGDYIRE